MSKIDPKKFKRMASKVTDVDDLKRRCPMRELMKHIGLAKYAVPSCKSPFRDDKEASWGVNEFEGQWYFKDHGDGDSGDEITLLARHLGLDHKKHFAALLGVYKAIVEVHEASAPATPRTDANLEAKVALPDKKGFGPGTDDQLMRLSQLRGFSTGSLQWAQQRGVLVFANWNGNEVWGITDNSGKVIEVRRLDGQMFPSVGSLPQRKSHALKHSSKSWPLGLPEAKAVQNIALVEGMPDFLAAHHLINKEQSQDKPQGLPVAMLSANVNISEEALTQFKGKSVVIYAHVDGPGLGGANRWKTQLEGVGAKVKIFDISKVAQALKSDVKDLNDIIKVPEFDKQPGLNQIMPLN